jgi:TrmH family RNA methyltransferase
MIITSQANPTIKHVRKLYDRKYRENYQQFIVEGLRLAAEVFEEAIPVEYLIVSDKLLSSEFGIRLKNDFIEAGCKVLNVSPDVFKRISQKDGPQGIAAVGNQVWYDLNTIRPEINDLWIALDRVQDPGNLGTIMRTADAVGCTGIILLGNCTDPYDPSALRASMGAAFSLKLVKATNEDLADWKLESDIKLVGTSDKALTHYRHWVYPERLVVVMGSEREGLHPDLMTLCDELVSIPMSGKSDSLNLAVATGVILYEYYEQNRWKNPGDSEK